MTKTQYLAAFGQARRAGVPLLAIATPDPRSTIDTLSAHPDAAKSLKFRYDTASGFVGLTDGAVTWCNENSVDASAYVGDPGKIVEVCTDVCPRLPAESLVFVLNGSGYFDERLTAAQQMPVFQAIWSLRDPFQSDGRVFILLGPSFTTIPPVLANDFVTLREPYPTPDDLASLTREIMIRDAKMKAPSDDEVRRAVEAIIGLPTFPAQTALSMSLTTKGVDFDSLWDRKKQMIANTKGLSVADYPVKFDDIGGHEALKVRFRQVFNAKRRPRVVVWIDEGEKSLRSASTESSGTTGDQLQQLLVWMQDYANGGLLVGPPGCTKSMFPKALAKEFGVPCIAFDLGGMKGQYVGQSEERVRTALDVINAIAQGFAFVVMTCNEIDAIPNELQRRFRVGTWFCDLPNAEEKSVVWSIYVKKYALTVGPKNPLPNDDGWSPAQIAACAENADNYSITLTDAAKGIVPVSRAMADRLARLRSNAEKFGWLSSTSGEPYSPVTSTKVTPPEEGRRRRITVA